MIDFDLQSYADRVAPPGEYLLRVVGIPELKHTKANNGSRFLEVNFKIVDGFMSGHFISRKFNLYNCSETAERIARKQFYTFCEAVGLENIKTYAQLEGCNVRGKVSESVYNDQRKNEIDSFTKYEGTVRVPEAELTTPPDFLHAAQEFNDSIPF